MPGLVWFRSDLRTSDHPALAAACSDHGPGVRAIFVATPEQWDLHDWGPRKIAFVLGSVWVLARSLGNLGIPLEVVNTTTYAQAAVAVAEAARRMHASVVYASHETGVNEKRRDERTARALLAHAIQFRPFHADTILTPGSIRTGDDKPYSVFTAFRRAALLALSADPVSPVGGIGRVGAPVEPVALPEYLRRGLHSDASAGERWPPGEPAALDRLRRFVREGLGDYARARDSLAIDGTSALSPYLAVGCLSTTRGLVEAIHADGGRLDRLSPGPAAWISELLWREFYRHLFDAHPRLSKGRAFKVETERVPWRHDERGLAAWREGRTGVPVVDAGMRQLLETRWMHNRARMITAMFLTKDLLIDWREGERHFMRHLLDADLAQNNSGWQWAASTGTDAAPYFRVFNPFTQSRRFDPEGVYIRRWVPELRNVEGDAIHDPPPLVRAASGYPPAIVDHSEARARAIAAFRGLG